MKLRKPLHKGAVAAAFAAALAVCAPVAVAGDTDSWQPSEDDELLLELRYSTYKLGDTLRGYQTPEGICVDFADVIQAMDLPVRLDKKSRRATGWIFAEEERFILDRDNNTVQTVNNSAKLSSADLRDTPEGWCVGLRPLSAWLGVTLRADLGNLAVVMETQRKLPFLEAIERKSRAARLHPSINSFDLAKLPQAELPYKAWRTPSVDVLVRAGWRSTPGGKSATDIIYEAYASGEALGASFDARLASDGSGVPKSLRLKAYRVDPAGGLLGPLKATRLAAGDVESFAGNLTGQSAVGRGLFISNRPITRPSRFSVTTLRGELPAGWDAELYRNGQLMAFQANRGDGRYQFDDVELHFGENALEVVLYGPQGQVRRDRSDFPVGGESIPAGQTYYWAGILEQNRDLITFGHRLVDPQIGWRWGVGVERGIDKRTTLGLGAQSLMLKGLRRNYIEATATRGIGPMLFELSGAQQLGHGGGKALQGQMLGRIGRINVQAEAIWANGGYESEVISAQQSREFGLRLDSEVKIGGQRVPIQLSANQTLARDGTKVNKWLARTSMMMRGLALTAELSDTKSIGPKANIRDDGMRLRLLANSRIGKLRLRGDTKFRISGFYKGFESAKITGDINMGPRSDLRASAEYLASDRSAEFGLGYVRQFKRFALRTDATVSSRGKLGLNMSLAMSFGPDPVDGGWRMSGNKLAEFGQADVTVFRDENGDGIRQSGEEAVAGVEVATGFGAEQRKTNAEGRALIDGLRPFTPVLVNVDSSSIEDPLLQPKGKGVVVTPRPGIAAKVLLALAPTGEVEGTLLGIDGEVREGVRLELTDARGQIIAQTQTEYDGYFLFDKVPYGEYSLRIASASAEALEARAALGIGVKLNRANPTIRTGMVRTEPLISAAQAVAAK